MNSSPFGWARAAAAGLAFRAVTEGDLPFLHRVYASTRADEMALIDWTPEQKAAFVDMQFKAQHGDYTMKYPDMLWLVILRAGEAIGRLYLDRLEREHSIVDITFLPEHRGAGLGSALLADLLEEAAAAGKRMTIYVEKYNPAYRLYGRLGFVAVQEEGVYDLLRWTPPPPAA
jgi:ribosomal protein S18 acetylase RimI-like enzyme